ncbi:MAG: hypothetical protein ACI9F2_000521, partial [Lysobacterales bacterium]
MSERYIRVFQKIDVKKVGENLLIFGDLSAVCGKCNEMGLALQDHKCKACDTEFKYIAFRNVRNHLPKLRNLSQQ